MNDRIKNIKDTVSIIDLATTLGLDPKGYGDNTQIARCFKHEDRHPSLVLMPAVNHFQCKSCGAKGDVIDLVSEMKHLELKDALDYLDPNYEPIKISSKDFLKNRGLTDETVEKFKLSVVNDAIAIPLSTGVKYRRINPTGKDERYYQKAGTTTCIFKTQEAHKKVILVEGEFDAMLMWQIAGYPVWSFSTGAATDAKKFVEEFKDMEKIFIAYDNDDAGEEGAKQLAQTLGIDRCFRLEVPKAFGKDWTDYFIYGQVKENLDVLLADARSYDSTLLDLFLSQADKGDFRMDSGFDPIDKVVGGFRSGNVYVIAGLEKSGKSAFLMNILDHLLGEGVKVGYINTELMFSEYINRMAAIRNSITIAEVEGNSEIAKDWLKKHQGNLLYAGLDQELITEKNLVSFDKTMVQMKNFLRKGMKVLMVDNLTTYAAQADKKKGWEVLSGCISSLISFAKENNIIVFTVIHTKQDVVYNETAQGMRKIIESGEVEKIFKDSVTVVRKPTLADVYGGGGALSQISGIMFVWRPLQKFDLSVWSSQAAIIIDSLRHAESGQTIRMEFDGSKGLFLERGYDAPFMQPGFEVQEAEIENET